MKNIEKILVLILILALPHDALSNSTVKVKLTGTLKEDVEMTVGKNGRKMIISSLPYTFQVAKNQLPINLSFRSNSYTYYDITVPKKPTDDIGHVYLLKVEETVNFRQNNNLSFTQEQPRQEIKKGIDTSNGIDAAPITGKKAENTYALIIANEEYEMVGKVDMATYDGLAVKEYFINTFGLTDNQILYRPNATYAKITQAIGKIKKIAEAYKGNINLVVYYAGHGIPDNETKDAYILPTDADGNDPSVCYSLSRLYNEIDAMHLNQSVVLLDACFSGTKRDGDMIVPARGVSIKTNVEVPSGSTVIMSATSEAQTAFAYKEKKHGLFTYFLLKYFQEKKGKVNLGDLADYLSKNVSQQSIVINGHVQTPTIIASETMTDWRSKNLTDMK